MRKTIYVVEANGLEVVKIGITSDLKSRLNTIKANCPRPIKLLVAIPDATTQQKNYLHDLFKQVRSHDDWFGMSNEVVSFIERSKKGTFPMSLGKPIEAPAREAVTLSPWQHEIVRGCLFGSGSITRQGSFLICERKQQEWLEYKAAELASACNNQVKKYKNRWQWWTPINPLWEEMKKDHYHGSKKIIDPSVLDVRRDIALAIWFGDKGYWPTKRRVGLRTANYNLHSNKRIETYFCSMNIECIIQQHNYTNRIVFSQDGTERFLQMIAHLLPACRRHKLSP